MVHILVALPLLVNTQSQLQSGVCVSACVCASLCIRLSPIHQGGKADSLTPSCSISGGWFSRPKPHVIYLATSPTNYSLHTAAEHQQPHTFHTLFTNIKKKRVSESERKKRKRQNIKILNNPAISGTYRKCAYQHVGEYSYEVLSLLVSCVFVYAFFRIYGTSYSLCLLPICMTRPKTEELSTVLQFQRRCLNWYWHSLMPVLAPSPMYCMWSW